MMDSVTSGIICFLASVSLAAQQTGFRCPDLQPPENGVLKCQTLNNSLQCTATCLEGRLFDGGDNVIHRTCVSQNPTLSQGSSPLPPCVLMCNSSLMEGPSSHMTTSSSLSPAPPRASFPFNSANPGQNDNAGQVSALSTRHVWRPSVDNILQYIQADLGRVHTIKAWRLRGDGAGSFVRLFRLLFSLDGVRWTPYSDGRVVDKFLTGSFDSGTEVTGQLSTPQVARYVRLNPLSWQRHIAVVWDLVGCPYTATELTGDNTCPLPQPPESGAVNCERNGSHVVCTAYCLDNRIFPDLGPALDLTCDPSVGEFTNTPLPGCVEPDTTVPPLNISGPCLQEERDCSLTPNGDYQYCSHCHYFSTCSHGYFFVRPCPEQLQFDSRQGLCDYHSATCRNHSHTLTHP